MLLEEPPEEREDAAQLIIMDRINEEADRLLMVEQGEKTSLWTFKF